MKAWKWFKMALLHVILKMFLNRKEMEVMDVIYATLIQEGHKTINDVRPESMKRRVCEILLVLGLPELVPTEFGGVMEPAKKAV